MRNKINVNTLNLSTQVTNTTDSHDGLFLKKHLYFLVTSLEGVYQNPRYHPEKDALHHSLQVFQRACEATSDPELWAAALLHDIGKAIKTPDHAKTGADELEGLLSPRIVWLIRHHMHLLIAPKRTRRWLYNTPQLRELERLRTWDLQGRLPSASVISPNEALNILIPYSTVLQSQQSETTLYYDSKILG